MYKKLDKRDDTIKYSSDVEANIDIGTSKPPAKMKNATIHEPATCNIILKDVEKMKQMNIPVI